MLDDGGGRGFTFHSRSIRVLDGNTMVIFSYYFMNTKLLLFLESLSISLSHLSGTIRRGSTIEILKKRHKMCHLFANHQYVCVANHLEETRSTKFRNT